MSGSDAGAWFASDAQYIALDATGAGRNLLGNSLAYVRTSGTADNRRSRRTRERKRIDQMWHDRALFSQVICWTDLSTFSGDYVARPQPTGISLAVIP